MSVGRVADQKTLKILGAWDRKALKGTCWGSRCERPGEDSGCWSRVRWSSLSRSPPHPLPPAPHHNTPRVFYFPRRSRLLSQHHVPSGNERCFIIHRILSCSINPLPDALISSFFFLNGLSPACGDGVKPAFCWLEPWDCGEGEEGGWTLPALCQPCRGWVAARSSSSHRTSPQLLPASGDMGKSYRMWWNLPFCSWRGLCHRP